MDAFRAGMPDGLANSAVGGVAAGVSKNFAVFKEPRGMIKILQLVMCIFTFATTTSYVGGFTVTFVNCLLIKDATGKEALSDRSYLFEWSYPFRVAETNKYVPSPCKQVAQEPVSLIWGDYSTSSQFFVAVGVISMLYVLAAIVLYIFFDAAYRGSGRLAQYDFLTSCAITCFWLLSSAAWSAGVSDLKFYTEPMRVLRDIDYCRDNSTRRVNTANCVVDEDDYPDYASLHVSLIGGFACFALWAGSLWFLFKETSYAESVLPSMQNPWDSVATNLGNTSGMGMPGSQPSASNVPNPFAYGGTASLSNGQFDGRYAQGAAMGAPGAYGAGPGTYMSSGPGQAAFGQSTGPVGMPNM